MVIKRGEIWWASPGDPKGSGPGYRRPVVVIQSNPFNDSNIRTVIVAAITSNLKLEKAPGNIKLKKSKRLGLNKDSVLNVSQVYTIDRDFLTRKAGKLTPGHVEELNEGLKLVMAL